MKNYGQGKSTGFEQTVSRSIETGFVLKDMAISDSDAEVLRPLAERVAIIASSAPSLGENPPLANGSRLKYLALKL